MTGILYYYLVTTKSCFNNDFSSIPSILLLIILALLCIFFIYRDYHGHFVVCDDRLIQIGNFFELTIMYSEIIAIEEVDNGATWLILKSRGKSLGRTEAKSTINLMCELRKRLELYGIDTKSITQYSHIPWYL